MNVSSDLVMQQAFHREARGKLEGASQIALPCGTLALSIKIKEWRYGV